MALKDKLMQLATRGGATPAQVEEIADEIAQSGGLPAVSASDNGKFLRVVDGAWAAQTAAIPSGGGAVESVNGKTGVSVSVDGNALVISTDGNQFSFASAHDNIGVIASHGITESASYGTKDSENKQFIVKSGFNSATFGSYGGVKTMADGWYKLTAQVKVPTAGKKVAFGAKPLSSYVTGGHYWDEFTISSANEWTGVEFIIQIENEQTGIVVCMMSENTNDISYWRNITVKYSDSYSGFDGDSSAISNVLSGKKWSVCGDSFTENGYTQEDGFPESVYKYQSGRFKGKYRVYGNIIGLRNDMDIDMQALSGQTLTSLTNNSFMNVYQNIPVDADYITIMLGINDKLYAERNGISMSTLVGSIGDTSTTTIYGAFNTALSYLVQNHPFAHIGIIVSNGTNAEIMAATRAAARKWGIPYLDMGSDQVPMVPRYTGKESYVSQTVLDFVQNTYTINPGTNNHPNAACHEYESTFIEAWLRTL